MRGRNVLMVFGKEVELERLDPIAAARLSDHPVINDRGSFPRRIDDRLILCWCNYSIGAICCTSDSSYVVAAAEIFNSSL